MKLTAVAEKFILHWGEMGTRWGINRSVAQIHALLMISPTPLPADEISETLGIARSNVSTGLKELQSWGLLKNTHQLGDRRDHFSTLDDVWEMFLIIMRERRKRELDPTLTLLRDCLDDATVAKDTDAKALKRLTDLTDFMEQAARWCDRSQNLSPTAARRFAKLTDKIFALAG